MVLFDPLVGPLSDATILGQSGPGSNGNEGVLSIPQTLASLEPHHQIEVGRVVFPLQTYSQCILQSS